MKLLIIDDDDTLRGLLEKEVARMGYQVTSAATGTEGLLKASEVEPELVMLDLILPDLAGTEVLRRLRAGHNPPEVVMLTAHGTIDTAIQAIKLGAYHYLQKPCHLAELQIVLQHAAERRNLSEENARLRDGFGTRTLGADFVGHGPAFEELRHFTEKVAASDATILIRGETGTGKELVARSIHQLSPRRERPFVVVDCAAMNENLLQSELFGHEKGAFTGASRLKHGLFEAAEGGTVFLDEIGDVSPLLQAGLLRVLEASTFRRVGGTQELHANVRLVAATNRDLERLMADGQFRQDLYFRLNTIHITTPPLRRRRDEIPHLIAHFLARHNARFGTRKQASPEALEVMQAYQWPGNVRELRHAVERALVVADGDVFTAGDLPAEVRECPKLLEQAEAATGAGAKPLPARESHSLAANERRHIERALAEAKGHRLHAAQALGISERTLYRKIREFGLEGAAPDDGTGMP